MPEESARLVQPREHKARISIWSDLSVTDMDRLDEASTPDEIKQELAQIFDISNYQEDLKDGILLDLYFYTIQFCRDNNFTQAQTSALFSIIKKTHEICVETPFGNVQQCFSFFKEALLCHAVKRPPFSIDLFAAEEVKAITQYVLNTYFRHFKMYKYAFTPVVQLDLSIVYEGMPETPPPSEHPEENTQGQETEEMVATGSSETVASKEEPSQECSQTEESEAAKELRNLIKGHLSEELKKLKVSMDAKIKESEDVLNKKLNDMETSAGVTGKKSAGKGRRK